MKNKVWIIGVVLLFGLLVLIGMFFLKHNLINKEKIVIDITNLKRNGEKIKTYEISDYEKFIEDFNNNSLSDVYITRFLFDGAGMYKAYDLDDFIEKGNDLEVDVLETTVINVSKTGSYELKGELVGGMIAVNTNEKKGDINILLNGVNIDTDSKKIPAIYIYNKDITYTDCKVTIESLNNTENYIEGGKLKKVSLLSSNELDSYINKYTGNIQNNYSKYSNYYGVYSKDKIDNVLFATVTADREDLEDGDPYLYYKGSGAISSDIDLYFTGEGFLKVVSKGKEGIESKGDLSFVGGVGDYTIVAKDDCLNTTTDDKENKNAHNDLVIDVHSLTAIVDLEADEGDAIDSNGKLTINGGNIIAIAKNRQDSGLDSEKGIIINGGRVLATGDMYEDISSSSKQKFIVLTFGENVKGESLITMLNDKDEVTFSYLTDRDYKVLIYSSDDILDGNYTLYKDGSIEGEENNGLYLSGTYSKGIQLGYTSQNEINRFFGEERPEGNPPEMPNGEERPEGNPPEMPNGEVRPEGNPPEMPDNQRGGFDMLDREKMNGNMMPGGFNNIKTNATNKTFTINKISNLFNGISELVIA